APRRSNPNPEGRSRHECRTPSSVSASLAITRTPTPPQLRSNARCFPRSCIRRGDDAITLNGDALILQTNHPLNLPLTPMHELITVPDQHKNPALHLDFDAKREMKVLFAYAPLRRWHARVAPPRTH
ncbi:MAG: hypothetical protein ACREEU_10150, partial [Acetobacteraceae bacterium]